MKKILLFFLITPLFVFSQSNRKADSLRSSIQITKDFKLKSKKYIQLYSLLQRSDMNAAKSYLDSARKFRPLTNDSLNMVINKSYADYFEDNGQPDTAIKYIGNTIILAAKLQNDSMKAAALNVKGNALMAKRNFKGAQTAYLEAMKVYTLLNNQYAIGNLYINLGYLFQQQRFINEAEKQYNEAEIIFKKQADKGRLAQLYNNYGILYGENDQLNKSEHYFTESMKIREKLPDQLGLANSYLNVGGINVLLKNYKKGEEYLLKSKQQFEKIRNVQGVTSCLTNLGDLEDQQKHYTKAETYYKQSIVLSKTNKNMEDLENALLGLSKLYQKTGDYKSAYLYQDELTDLKDTLYERSLTQQIAEMQTKYETGKKEQQISLLNKENIIQKLSIASRNKTIGIIATIFLICLGSGIFYYKSYKNKHETSLKDEVIRQQTLASHGIIEAEERERKRIAGELHDGIGQLFTVVKMNMETLVERFVVKKPEANSLAEKTIALVDESCIEIRSIAHQMMPNALIKSGLVSALRDFINKIPSEKLKISIETKGINDRLESTTETVLYRVIQESVNNVIKHADATSLDILMLCDEKEITVSIEDNGKGFNSVEKNKFSGIGLKNIISRIEYLKGTVDISSSPGKGTLVAIYIPIG